MSKVSDFQVMGEMATQNLDIRLFPTIVGAKFSKKGGEVEMGVNHTTIHDMVADKVYCVLLVMDKTQFDETKKLLEK